MKMIKTLYLRSTSKLTTIDDVFGSVFLADEDTECTPINWVKLKDIQIDVPNSLIADIIKTNTKIDFDSEINKHKAQIIRLEELRSKQE